MMKTPRQQGDIAGSERCQRLLVPSTIGVLVAIVFGVWRWSAVDQLPVWDGAMGMTPAAVTLESLNFDIGRLLEMPDYLHGGPNLHSLSLATWFVAASIRVFGSYSNALPILHIISFSLIGAVAAGVWRASSFFGLPRASAAVVTIASVLFPPMVVQGSDVYLDLPLAVCILWAWVYVIERRYGAALFFVILASSIKPSALIAIPALAAFLLMDNPKMWKRLFAFSIPVAIAAAPVLLDRSLRTRDEPLQSFLAPFQASTLYLLKMPVLVALTLATLVLVLASRLSAFRARLSPRSHALLIATAWFVLSFVGFFLMNPLVTKGVVALPRYTIMLVPLLLLSISVAVTEIMSGKAALTLGVGILAIFALNIHGDLEPGSSWAFWLSERSLAYEDQLAVQRASFAQFQDFAAVMPSYYGHLTHYRIEYPEMGWSTEAILDGTAIHLSDAYDNFDLSTAPDRFVMLIENPSWFGGSQLVAIQEEAEHEPDWDVEVHRHTKGEYLIDVVVVSRRRQPPPN